MPFKIEQFFEYTGDDPDITAKKVLEFIFDRTPAEELLPGDDPEEARSKLFNAMYDIKSRIRLWVKRPNGRVFFINYDFTPYLYVRADSFDIDSLPSRIAGAIEKVVPVRRRDIELDQEFTFQKVYVKNTLLFNKVRFGLAREGYDVREDKVFFEQRFIIDTGIEFDRWARFKVRDDKKIRFNGFTGYEGVIFNENEVAYVVLPDEEVRKRNLPKWPPMRYFVFDIEVYNKFGMTPDKAPVIAVGVMIVDDTSEGIKEEYHVLTADEDDPMSERELLRNFVKLVRRTDPDVIVGHNSSQFDVPFLFERAKKHGVKFVIGRLGDKPFVRVHKRIGDENTFLNLEYKGWSLSGRVIADTLFISKRDIVGLNTYNLKDILESLGVRKKEERVILPGHKLWEFWERDKELVLEYLEDDVRDTVKLWLHLLPLQRAFIKYLRRPLQEVVSADTSNIVESVILNKAFELNYVMPKKIEAKGGYSGAFVHYPSVGINENVNVVDFKSLYPTTIVTWNISIESYLGEKTVEEVEEEFGIRFKDDLDVYAFVISMYEVEKISYIAYYDQRTVDAIMEIISKFGRMFKNYGELPEKKKKELHREVVEILREAKRVEKAKAVIDALVESEGRPNFIPALEKFLLYDASYEAFSPMVIKEILFERFKLKKMMKEEPDEEKKKELDFQQNALKKIVNSAYGYYGYVNAMMFRPHVAESITAGGRMAILFTINFATLFGMKSIYGDTDSEFLSLGKFWKEATRKWIAGEDVNTIIEEEHERTKKKILERVRAVREKIVERKRDRIVKTVKTAKRGTT